MRAAAARRRWGAASLRLEKPTAGEILYNGIDIARLGRRELVALRRRIQVIFQDPYSSLNPRQKVGSIIGEPMMVHGVEKDAAAAPIGCASCCRCAGSTRISPTAIRMRCRAASASASASHGALALNPEFIVCDEAVLGARRVNSGADHQSARGSPRQVQPDLSLHRARSVGGAASLSAGRGMYPAGSSSSPIATSCSTTRSTPTPRPCSPRCRCRIRQSRPSARSNR